MKIKLMLFESAHTNRHQSRQPCFEKNYLNQQKILFVTNERIAPGPR